MALRPSKKMASKRVRVTIPQFLESEQEKENLLEDLNRMGC